MTGQDARGGGRKTQQVQIPKDVLALAKSVVAATRNTAAPNRIAVEVERNASAPSRTAGSRSRAKIVTALRKLHPMD